MDVLQSTTARDTVSPTQGGLGIVRAIKPRDKMTSLGLARCGIGPTGAKEITEYVSGSAVLTKLNLDGFELNLPQLRGTEPVEKLDLSDKRLGVASGIVIAKLLEFNAVLTSLNLADIRLDSEAGKALADALSVNAVLTKLDVRYTDIYGEAAHQLASAALGSKSLEVLSKVPIKELREDKHTSLDLRCKALGLTEGIVLAELLKGSAVLTSLNLYSNGLDAEAGKALAKALEVNAVLTSLDLSSNRLDAEAGKALAKALEVNAVLKSIDLRYNNMGDEGNKAVREALKAREAFDLKL